MKQKAVIADTTVLDGVDPAQLLLEIPIRTSATTTVLHQGRLRLGIEMRPLVAKTRSMEI